MVGLNVDDFFTRHLAFGHGAHFCPGAPLARADGRITLERLLDRTTEIRISDEHHGPPENRRYPDGGLTWPSTSPGR